MYRRIFRYKSILFSSLAAVILLSCQPFWGNTIREYRDKCFMFDPASLQIVSRCKFPEPGITGLEIMQMDSSGKKYERLVFSDSLVRDFDTYSPELSDSVKESLAGRHVEIDIRIGKYKTWYSVAISPDEWKKGKCKYFIKNVW